MRKNKNCALSLSGIVDKMNDMYEGVIGDGFNLGVDRRVVPVMNSEGEVSGWKIQQVVGDVWIDLCDETFNSMTELIERYREYTEKELENINE
jgi:hypothetical protein